MPQQDPNLPDSIILGQFSGLKNTVNRERLSPQELEIARNVDIDVTGQVRRRRGYTQKLDGSWHSIKDIEGKVYGVRDGILGIVRSDYSIQVLTGVGASPICYTTVNNDVYFSGSTSGVITLEEEVLPWGATDGQGAWVSPVYTPTEFLGEVGGTLVGDPPKATCLAAYKGRIYLAVGKILWATLLYRYHYVDRTKNFMQFEHDITLLAAMDDGLYVGTTGGLYFIQGVLGAFQLQQVADGAVLPGSGVNVPADLVHPQARNQDMPTGAAVMMVTADGVVAGFDSGSAYNLTREKVLLPTAFSAAALFRQDLGDNSYVVALSSDGGSSAAATLVEQPSATSDAPAVDTGTTLATASTYSGPSSNTRIGDFVDATIVRKVSRGHTKAAKTSVISVTVAEGIAVAQEVLAEVASAGVPQGATYSVTMAEGVVVSDA